MREFEFLPDAEEEFLKALEYYRTISTALSRRFFRRFSQARDHIKIFPELGNPFEARTRRFLISEFPYEVIYLCPKDRIVGIAFAHLSMRPGYWVSRLGTDKEK